MSEPLINILRHRPLIYTFICITNQDMVIFYIVYKIQKLDVTEMTEGKNH